MLKRKFMAGMISAAVMAGASFPAGAEEADVILDRVDAALEEIQYFEGTADIRMPVSLEYGEVSAEVPVEINGTFRADTGNRQAAMSFTLDADAEDGNVHTEYDIYIQDKMLYVSENGGEWMVQETGGEGQEGILSGTLSALKAVSGNTGMEESMEEADGTECHVLRAAIPSGSFLEIMGGPAGISGSGTGIMEDAELELYIGAEDYLPRELRTGFTLYDDMDDEEGMLSCSVEADIRITSYEPQEIAIPAEVLEADAGISDTGEPEKTDSWEIPEDDDFLVTEGTAVNVSCGDGNGITFELPTDMENTTYDKSMTDYLCFSTDRAELTAEADGYYDTADNMESDRNFYMEGEYSDGFMDVEEFGFSVPAGSVSGIFFKSVHDGSVSYTSALAYIDIGDVCYKFDYTVYEEAEADEITGFIRKVCESIKNA